MRGIVSEQLKPFLTQVNVAIEEAKKNNISFSAKIIRENLDKFSEFIGQGPEIAFVKDRVITVEGRYIPVRVYDPAPTEKRPVMLHFHGGGHMCGSIELYDTISRKIAAITRCIVICVEYRLSPEHPYPAGINDCQDALINYQQALTGMNYTNDIYIIGDSAGGAICTTLTSNSLTNAAIKIDKQILIYPSVDYTMSSASIDENGHGFLLEKEKVTWYFEQYFQTLAKDKESIKNASPLLGPFSNKMPQTLIITAGCDPLRDEGIAYANALKASGVMVEHYQFDGMIHAYMLLHSLVPSECLETYQRIKNFI